MARRVISARASSRAAASRRTYYDPLIGEGIARLMRPNTKVVYCESPGSLTFRGAGHPGDRRNRPPPRRQGADDNTWGTPFLFRSFEHGVDVSIHAATNTSAAIPTRCSAPSSPTRRIFSPCVPRWRQIGHSAAPDDVFFALRGMRTLSVRLERHQKNALEVARWLQTRPEVSRVLYPALPEDPGHALWKRDFLGASGLFGVVLKAVPKEAVNGFIDALDLFGIGASWGGFESLIQPPSPIAPAPRPSAGRRALGAPPHRPRRSPSMT